MPQELSQEEFFDGISAPRNKELMRVFKDVRLVEQLGSGVQRILKAYDRSVFKFSANFLKVIFPVKNDVKWRVNDGVKLFKLSNTQKDIINLVKQNNYITQAEISDKLNKSIRTIERNMKKLQDNDIINRVGSDRDGYWKVIK